ncbi:hypothetical protein GCM10027289_25000 [Tsukamurella serpentis]
MKQPGYDAMADRYAEAFGEPYQFPMERHAAAAFAEEAVLRCGRTVDVGCGLGHVSADLTARGLDVIGVDPSPGMLRHARRMYPRLHFADGDALLTELPGIEIAAVVARFSLIHLPPERVRETLHRWADRCAPGTPVLVAFQTGDRGDPTPFDHAVAPAWRWHPDGFAAALDDAGFAEGWRIIYRDNDYRFDMAHLLARRR